MIDREEYLTFAVQLHRFCNAPIPPHYTCELLRSLWWIPPAGSTSAWDWRVDRLVHLMMLANQRAVWHRYERGRHRERASNAVDQHRSAKLAPLKPAHRYHQPPFTDAELVTLYKFTGCALYQSSEWSGGPEQVPRLVKLMQQLEAALAQDVLTHLSLWEQAPWGSMG
ncbi:hypothetical protein D3C80_1535840 [compost metagenome]